MQHPLPLILRRIPSVTCVYLYLLSSYSSEALEHSPKNPSCSCDACVTAWQPQMHYTLSDPKGNQMQLKEGSERGSHESLKCSARNTTEAVPCASFCLSECSPVIPKSKADDLPSCETRKTSHEKAPALSLRQLSVLHSLSKACPAPQPCSCWCHCPEILFGVPPPPGIPPPPAVNPFAPPPPVPKPPPQPYAAGPPPALGVPFNPAVPAFLQIAQPCSGPECGPSGKCPLSMPCNCYCRCRGPVPPRSKVFGFLETAAKVKLHQ